MATNKKNILLGVTASIAAYKVCDLITDFRKANFQVTPVMTKDAHHFVTPLILQSFSGRQVIEDFFSVGTREKPIHIELAKQNDVILVAPASADIIAKLANGSVAHQLLQLVLSLVQPLGSLFRGVKTLGHGIVVSSATPSS